MTTFDLDAQPKSIRRQTHPEWAVQAAVKWAVARAVACDYEFASHDRAKQYSEGQHIWEARRGVRRDWPDTELLCMGGLTFNCELKKPGWKPSAPGTKARKEWDAGQGKMIGRLRILGRQAAWANCPSMYLAEAHAVGVPLHPNWRITAQLADQQMLADIRRQEVSRDRAEAGVVVKGPRKKVPHSRIKRAEAVRGRVLF